MPQDGLLGFVPGEMPLVLLPVRLETRFRQSGANTDLLIRIYPDDLHIDTHESALTSEEAAWGRTYWEQTWRGGRSDGRERKAWTQIAEHFTPERAAWIVRSLEPRNPDARPDSEIPPDAPLPVRPRFPVLPLRDAPQTRAPLAQFMPDRWIAMGTDAGGGRLFTALSRPVRDPLPAGPAPDPSEQPAEGARPVDDGMKWLIDFDEALAAGMALRVRLPATQPAGVARLVVMGVKSSLGPDASARRLAALIDAQHYTRGIECVARGTPTNNSTAVRAGLGLADIGHVRSYADERGAPLSRAGDGLAGDRLAASCGIDTGVFAHVRNAGGTDPVDQANMNAALWPATIGYFLDQRLRGVVSDGELRAVRRHFVDHVRAGGPLPILRFGRQPYGCLPVTSFDRWVPRDGEDIGPRAMSALRALRDAFRRALPGVPRLEGTDLDRDLIAVLQMQGVSGSFLVRPVLGPELVENFTALAGINIDQLWWNVQQELARPPIAIPGMPALTPQSTAVFSSLTRKLNVPLARASEYPGLLAAASSQQLRRDEFPGAETRTLLDRLLRQGLLQEYALAARRLGARMVPPVTFDESEPELVDIRPQPSVTIWRRLAGTLTGVTPPTTIGEFLDNPANERDASLGDLASTRSALRGLAGLDDARLDALLRETLDLASHRLDAWMTSLATRRLDALRRSKRNGVIVGGYGWLEDLRPGSARGSDGYLQGPSPDHAATAAMLASGFLSHRAESSATFAIDLSSKRIHQARYLLQGVQRGASPAALLGYRIERRLHELELDSFIQPFRTLAPLDVDGGSRNVCHGIHLLERWRARATDLEFQQVVPPSSTAAQAIDQLFLEVDDVVDALGDLLVADGVYQVGKGRGANAVTSFDGIVRGESFTDVEVLNTPRHGPSFLYRLTGFVNEAPQDSPWRAGAGRARALAEPRLNAWLGERFGDPGLVRWRVSGGPGQPLREVSLSELDLAPIDVTLMTPDELALHILLHAKAVAGAGAIVTGGRDTAWTPDLISLDEFVSFARAAREALARSRPLEAADLAVPEAAPAPDADLDDLQVRASAALTALEQTLAQLGAAREAGSDPAQAAALKRASEFGIPTRASDGSAMPLEAVEREVSRRVAEAGKAAGSDPIEREAERLRQIFGTSFLALPRFRASNGQELRRTFDASAALQGGDRFAADTWLVRNSMVRDGAGALMDLIRHARALGRPDADLTVGQLPHVDADRWVALPFVAGQRLEGRRLSIVATGAPPATPDAWITGLLFDEWHEVVPSSTETTGLAFHYDEPEARAPQAILIAVAPDAAQPWDTETLEAVLLETLELSKLRLVDQDAMTELDHYLPAIYVPSNAAGEAAAGEV
jgi:hypothetical protein